MAKAKSQPKAAPTEVDDGFDDQSPDNSTTTNKSTSTAKGGNFALTTDNLFQAYDDAKTYTDSLNDPFPEFQRIARNKPYPDLARKYPKVAEGSTAAYISQKPRDLIQQTPSGDVTVEVKDLPKGWSQEALDLVAQWELDYEIIPNANEDYPVFEKAQNSMEQALTVGFTCTTAPFYNHDGVWSPDMTMAYWGDVIQPQGYKSIKQSPFTFLVGWWPETRIDQILANPTKAKAGGWNVDELTNAKNELGTKDQKSETPSEKARGIPTNAVPIVVAHQKGVKAPIFTFNPDSKKIYRTQDNPDPRGHKNVQTLYGLVDGTNPFGLSVVEIAGAWQNLMDNDVQAYQYNRAYNVDPATIRTGNIGDGDLHPGATFTAQDEGDGIEVLSIDSTALSEYPTTYEWQRGVLMNLLNSPTSAGDGDAPLGTTPAGIRSANAGIDTDDLSYVQHIHDWFQEWGETALNLCFAMRKGKQQLTLDEATADQLRALSVEPVLDGKDNEVMVDGKPLMKFDGTLLNGNVLTFDFDMATLIIRFSVNGGSSKLQDETAQLQSLESLLNMVSENEILQQIAGTEKVAELYNKIVTISGVHDSDDLLIDIDALKKQQEDAQAQAEAQQNGTAAAAAGQGQGQMTPFGTLPNSIARIEQTAKAPSGTIAFDKMVPFGQLQMAAMGGIILRPQDVGLNPDFSPVAVDANGNPIPAGTNADPTPAPTAGQVIDGTQPAAAPTAQPTPVVKPPANPQVPKEIIAAVSNLLKAGLPHVLVPHALQALTEGVPYADILESIRNGQAQQEIAAQPAQAPAAQPVTA
jgi:hypothetical protein